jgi:hypothetical protein
MMAPGGHDIWRHDDNFRSAPIAQQTPHGPTVEL